MKTTCPHCRQPIEIDAESADALKALDSFECPTCAGEVPVPKAPPEPAPERPQALPSQQNDPLPNGLLAAFGRMNRTMRVLGMLVLLVIGGLAIFLATRKPGDTFNVDRTIRDQIIHNDFFTRLIASGETTEEELKKVQAFEPYGNGYIGLSEEGWTWSESRQLAQRTAAEVVDVAVLAQDGRKQLGAFLAEKFPFAVGRAVWVGDAGAPKLIDSPDLLDTKDRDRRHHVFLSWPKSGDWQNHGWSWVIPAEYDEAQPFSEWGLAAVRGGKQWGLINESGQFVLPPQFDLVEKFSDQGCARVQVGKAWGLVNRRGELAAKSEWEDVQDQINGFTPVKKAGKWGYLDAGGTLVIPCDWEDAWRFSPEGFAVVTRAGKRGIIDHGGKVIVEPEWDGAINFDQHGLGLVRRGESWALIDSTGKLLTEPVLKTQWKDRRWDLGVLPVEGGLIGMDGKAVTGDRADRLMAMMNAKTPVSEGLKRVETEQGTGFIDQMGEWGIPPREGRYRDFADGLAAFQEGRHWGFIDRSGQAVIKPEWDEVGDFSEGMAAVKREKKWGAIDAQ
ncbi:MAG: WG repeat-containing protein, partial [Verrucomicrobiales bacterium]|nr:WG repeat-containing protein [Verrucomicrobiales bacterium]